jgi:hypothetical protein
MTAAFFAKFEPSLTDLSIDYMAHVSDVGDTGWFSDGNPIDPPYNIEGMTVKLRGRAALFYDLSIHYYHDAEGWKDVGQNTFFGSTGRRGRVEAIGITVTAKPGLANS